MNTADLDDHDLETLAASILCDPAEHPPERVHEAWRAGLASAPRRVGLATTPGRPGPAPIAIAASAMVLAAVGGIALITPDRGGEADEEPSSSNTTVTAIDLTALGPAAGGAMGERDLGGLTDPARLPDCLGEHGENDADLLGAAPVAVDGRVRQLFVLSTGMPGRVTVLLTVNTCGTEPAAPLAHHSIGTPG